MGQFPFLVDTIYYKGIFQIVRAVYDHTLGLLPVPMVYVLFLILVWVIARILDNIWKQITRKEVNVIQKITASIIAVVNPLGYIIFAFYALWGWNYQRTSFEQRMEFTEIKPDTIALYRETLEVMEVLYEQRMGILDDSMHFEQELLPTNMESELREVQEKLISSWGEPTTGRVRIRKLRPSGILLRISTSGVYIPFVCEGHVDAGLHTLQFPFTMAHEMAHGYGYTDEGVCNFVGFLTCLQSEDKVLNYSGLLGYWRYQLSHLRTHAPYSYNMIRRQMPDAIRMDLNDIADQMDKYPDLFPKVRNAVYDSYLKSHGVKSGIANYNDIVRLVAQYKQSGEVLDF